MSSKLAWATVSKTEGRLERREGKREVSIKPQCYTYYLTTHKVTCNPSLATLGRLPLEKAVCISACPHTMLSDLELAVINRVSNDMRPGAASVFAQVDVSREHCTFRGGQTFFLVPLRTQNTLESCWTFNCVGPSARTPD